MRENLMNSAHKTSTPAYREGWDRIFGVSDASDKKGDCIEFANANDYFWENRSGPPGFWDHRYLVTLSEFGPTLMVNADNEQDALDFAIDCAEEQGWEGLFLDDLDIQELINRAVNDGYSDDLIYTYLDEYPSGGNHCRYLSSYNIFIKEVKRAGNARQM
jgi:hypothetical protein